MASVRDFLIRGLLAGLVAGIAAFGVAYLVGEPAINAAISIEESAAHDHGAPGDPEHLDAVPRSLQSTVGLLTGTLVTGATLGGLASLVTGLALGRFGRTGVRATALSVILVGFVSTVALPFATFPPSPPGVGDPDTVGTRTAVYFIALAISLIAAAVAVLVARRLAVRWGGWHAALAAIAGYLAVTVTAFALLPTYDEVPADFPATVLYAFRASSLLTQLTLWGVLGVTLAELLHRRRGAATPGEQPAGRLPAAVQ